MTIEVRCINSHARLDPRIHVLHKRRLPKIDGLPVKPGNDGGSSVPGYMGDNACT
jgi:hypothetical protein